MDKALGLIPSTREGEEEREKENENRDDREIPAL